MEDSSSDLGTIGRGAVLFGGGRAFTYLFEFLLTLIITRPLGAAAYGIYSYSIRVLSITTTIAELGSEHSLLRYIPRYAEEEARRDAVVTLAAISSFFVSASTGTVLFVLAPAITKVTLNAPALTDALRILAFVLPVNTLSTQITNVFRALELPSAQIITNDVIKPGLRLLAVGGVIAAGASIVGAIAAMGAAMAVSVGLAVWWLYESTDIRPSLDFNRSQAIEYYDYALPLTISRTGVVINNYIDILMLGIFVSAGSVGIYVVAVQLTNFILLPLLALNQLFPSIVSRLHDAGDGEAMGHIYTTITRWGITAALALAGYMIIFRGELLTLFGPEFTAGGVALVVLAGAKIGNAAVGPGGYLLTMTDHQYLNLLNQWVGAALNIGLNLLLIPRYGIVGAAIATAIAELVVNVARLIEVWHYEGLQPYACALLKPIMAVAIACVVMIYISPFRAGGRKLAVGALVGGLTFLGVLVALGLEPEERQLLSEFYP